MIFCWVQNLTTVWTMEKRSSLMRATVPQTSMYSLGLEVSTVSTSWCSAMNTPVRPMPALGRFIGKFKLKQNYSQILFMLTMLSWRANANTYTNVYQGRIFPIWMMTRGILIALFGVFLLLFFLLRETQKQDDSWLLPWKGRILLWGVLGADWNNDNKFKCMVYLQHQNEKWSFTAWPSQTTYMWISLS